LIKAKALIPVIQAGDIRSNNRSLHLKGAQ
jgi:hypothetical protein